MSSSGRTSPPLFGAGIVRLQALCAYPVFPGLCIAVVLFPFSVAACNVVSGLVLVFALLSGILWQGIRVFVVNSTTLGLCFIAYFLLMIGGLLWSIDFHWGLHVLGRQWYWLLLPVLIVSLAEPEKRKNFLLMISVGLTVNLVFCVLQAFEYVSVTTVSGSSANDATGHIGHIGFGLIYGVWAAWLTFIGLHLHGIRRWSVWGLACWAYIMVFAAQGRSGYVVAILMLMVVLFKSLQGISMVRLLSLMMGMLMLAASVLFFGFGKDRIYGAWVAVNSIGQVSIDKTQASPSSSAINYRFYMWKTALSIWGDHKLAGVGTGGFPAAVRERYDVGRLDLNAFGGHEQKVLMAHPHNQYLLNLVRWGPVGLLVFLALLFLWVKEGWTQSWRSPAEGGRVMISLSGLMLAIAGLFEPSMEEHFSAVFAVLLLGTGLAQSYEMTRKKEVAI